MWLYLTGALIACLLGAAPGALAAAESSGYIGLCIERFPDGMAIFDRANHGQVLSIFKGDQVWTTPLDSFIKLIQNDTATREIIKPTNSQNVSTSFPGAPLTSDKHLVSFFGFNSNDSFHNNLLIFHNTKLLRYQVTKVDSSALTGKLISTHTTTHWSNNVTLEKEDVALQTLWGAKILLVHVNGYSMGGPIYLLNQESFDYPIIVPTRRKQPIPYANLLRSTYKVPYSGSNVTHYLSFLATGFVCYDLKCVPFDKFIDCIPMVALYTQGFTYWLQYETNLNFRLLAIALIAIMVVNAVVALVFVSDQVNKFYMLS